MNPKIIFHKKVQKVKIVLNFHLYHIFRNVLLEKKNEWKENEKNPNQISYFLSKSIILQIFHIDFLFKNTQSHYYSIQENKITALVPSTRTDFTALLVLQTAQNTSMASWISPQTNATLKLEKRCHISTFKWGSLSSSWLELEGEGVADLLPGGDGEPWGSEPRLTWGFSWVRTLMGWGSIGGELFIRGWLWAGS